MSFSRKIIYAFCILLVMAGCKPGMFDSKNPHEQYAEKLRSSGLAENAMGKQWLEAADKSLAKPLTITIPYKEAGYFAVSEIRAVCYRLQAKQGQRITITLTKRPATGAVLFAELLRPADDGGTPHLAGTPDSSGVLNYEADNNEELYLRLQPELLVSVSYELTIIAGPSLAFPVRGGRSSDIGSVWGDQRDAGRRRHEGIDIFGKKGTPLVAAADGEVTRVGEGGLGGKYVWMKPSGKNISLYYAHLDKHIASSGQRVKKGDTLGLMGNTGNARTTPVHLHFGIYARGGAVDPLPYVKPISTKPGAIKGDISLLGSYARAKGKQKLYMNEGKTNDAEELEASAFLIIHGAAGNAYLVSLPDGREGFIPVSAVAGLSAARNITLAKGAPILDKPHTGAPIITISSADTNADVLALAYDYMLVKAGDITGWVQKN